MAAAQPIGVYGIGTTGSDCTTASGDVWFVWNQIATNSSLVTTGNGVSIATTTTYDPWPAWNVTATTISTISTISSGSTWTVWNQAMAITGGNGKTEAIRMRARATMGGTYAPRKKTEAEVQVELLRQKEYEERRLAQAAAALLAKEKSERLLFGALSPEQREDLLRRQCFHLYVGEKKYRIKRGTHGNVELLDAKDQPVKRYCAQPGGVPVDDAVLAQKLALEMDEAAFLRVANCTNLR